MDDKEKSIMTDLLVQNQALRNAANGFKARCEELEAKNRRLEEARENANAACAKWEGLYKAAETKRETLEKMVKEYQEVIIPGYRELGEKTGWISVKDRMPDQTQYVLAYDGTGSIYGDPCVGIVLMYKDSIGLSIMNNGFPFSKITHWMPLPEPPKEE